MTPDELVAMLRDMDAARPVIVCHDRDRAKVDQAVASVGGWGLAPRVVTSEWAKAGELVVIPRPAELWTVRP